MGKDNRGTISQKGSIMRIENALAEEVSDVNSPIDYLLVSYTVQKPNGGTSVELLRLNINKDTLILNASGVPVKLCDLCKGMWIDALFSAVMTRSIPPQSNAFLILARKEPQTSMSVTTDRILMIDAKNKLIYTGRPNDINSQMRFVITDSTTVSDRNGNPISLRFLRPGQLVRVTHANFQTASIPPQTTAFHIQLL